MPFSLIMGSKYGCLKREIQVLPRRTTKALAVSHISHTLLALVTAILLLDGGAATAWKIPKSGTNVSASRWRFLSFRRGSKSNFLGWGQKRQSGGVQLLKTATNGRSHDTGEVVPQNFDEYARDSLGRVAETEEEASEQRNRRAAIRGGGEVAKVAVISGTRDAEELLDVRSSLRAQLNKECKYIVVTGGVLSGIGKGVTASSIGVLCKMMGLRPTAIKIDPYLNVDAGTMSPFEHGEVFVLDDGGETDLDLGNYERFMGVNLRNESNLTTGKIYQHVIERERKGDYLGKTVQVVPHITDALQEWITDVSKKSVDQSDEQPDVCIIELGGTLGDIESMPFVEALRQLQGRVGYKNCCFVHVSLIPEIGSPGEQKTKPTQHSVKQMRELGLAPDFIMCRASRPIVPGTRDKLSMFCQVPPERVISVHDVSNIYRVPLLLLEQIHREVVIGLVGKYTDLHDTYLSVVKALLHASLHCERKLTVKWIDSSALDRAREQEDPEKFSNAWGTLRCCEGVLVPGGFGSRGLEGKIQAIKYARAKLGREKANSAEFATGLSAADEVIVFMPEGDRERMGGTMRLGSRVTVLRPGSRAFKLYGGNGNHGLEVHERHRHRYEVNPIIVDELESAGMRMVGKNNDGTGERMEVLELDEDEHPYFMGAQYHPEFKSRPGQPSPLFTGLIEAAAQFADRSSASALASASASVD